MSGALRTYVHRPQQTFLRRAMFQVHLWLGLAAALYVVLIALSGSVLVWKHELAQRSHPKPVVALQGSATVSPAQAVAAAQLAAPGKQPYYLDFPQPSTPFYAVYLRGIGMRSTVLVHPQTGAILDVDDGERGWLNKVAWFHYYLLMSSSRGLFWNGVGAAFLLMLALSSTMIWWPGLRSWERGFWIDFRLRYKRVVRDTHNVVGLWALALITIWAVSGLSFVWPDVVTRAISMVFPLSRERAAPARSDTLASVGLDRMALLATERLPAESLLAARLGTRPHAPTTFLFIAQEGMDDSESDDVLVAPNGQIQGFSAHGQRKQTYGDRVLAMLEPLHFGADWGPAIKVLYSVAGLGLAFLACSGVLMYWHRFLRARWKR